MSLRYVEVRRWFQFPESVATDGAEPSHRRLSISLVEPTHIAPATSAGPAMCSRDEVTVVCITGNGLKTQEALQNHVISPHYIKPNIASFEEALEKINT